MDEQRCGPECRVIIKTYDHLPPRVLLDHPHQIAVAFLEQGETAWASFKAQCRICRSMLGGYWISNGSASQPSAELLRTQAIRLLAADGCREDDEGWWCADCLGVPSDHRLRFDEGVPPVPLEGWPSEGG